MLIFIDLKLMNNSKLLRTINNSINNVDSNNIERKELFICQYFISQFIEIMRKTSWSCTRGCKHFKGVGSIPNSIN